MEAIALYPSPAIGHLISMVELAKLVLNRRPSLYIHIIIFEPPYNAGSTAPYIKKVSATIPSFIFHHLPTITLPPSITSTSRHHETLTFEVLLLSNPNLHQILLSISNDYTICAFIADFFCYASRSVTAELNIPSYFFCSSGAGFLSSSLYLPTIHRNTNKSFKDMDTLLHIPGVPPMPAKDMAKPLLERDDKAYQFVLDCSVVLPKSAGIILNTFESLEPRAVKAMRDGLSVTDGVTPPLYCIGPLIVSDGRKGSSSGAAGIDQKPECLAWLDTQPSRSVIFLCFGSLGLFSMEQLKEIALGLERSCQRFLWVVKNPPSKDKKMTIPDELDPDLDSILPDGFLDRTKERGFVLKSWAPQVAILNHEAVSGFVTHCGWNSVLEAVCAGVPMVAWPLYAEQRYNRILLVEEIKIALPMMESENGFVSSDEVEKRVRELMESEKGNSIREQTISMKNNAKEAVSEGGPSCVTLSKLVESWKLK